MNSQVICLIIVILDIHICKHEQDIKDIKLN